MNLTANVGVSILLLVIMTVLFIGGVVLTVCGIRSFKKKKKAAAVIFSVIGLILAILPVYMTASIFVGRILFQKTIARISAKEQIEDVPEMTLEHGPGLDAPVPVRRVEQVRPGTASWQYYDGKRISRWVADALHPLDSFDFMVKITGADKIKISFLYPPSYYTVSYWNEQYIGDPSAYEDYFQTLEIENDTIILSEILPDENGNGYVFEIKAVWETLNGIEGDGYAHYCFFAAER